MESFDNHINPPFTKIWVDDFSDYDNANRTEYVIQDAYDAMSYHDPITVYVILDNDRMYKGDQLIPTTKNGREYLIGYSHQKNRYVLYLSYTRERHTKLIPIAEYKDPNGALHGLMTFSTVGSHDRLAAHIYRMIKTYVDGDYGIHETILGIIADAGYRDDPRFQYLNELAISYEVSNLSKDLPVRFKEALHSLQDIHPGSCATAYSDIYDVFVKYDFFKNPNTEIIQNIVKDIMIALGNYIV